MNAPRPLPAFLTEDCLVLLRSLVGVAWSGVAALVGVELWIRGTQPQLWPGLEFPETYHGVTLEYTLNSIVLTALVLRRDWYERVPRASVNRLGWLLNAVLVWFSLHLLIGFHVSGGAHGPLLPLFPVLAATALLALPERRGWWLAAVLLLGPALVVVLENADWLPARGALTDAFSYSTPARPLGLIVLALAPSFTLAVALLAHHRFRQTELALHHGGRVDPLTGLFLRGFLAERMVQELGRIRRQGDCAALLLVRLEPLADDAASETRLREMSQALLGLVRLPSDTPARYSLGTLAVLLPASNAGGVNVVAERLRAGLTRFGARFGAALMEADTHATADQIFAAAERALAQRGDTVPVVKA